MESKQRSESAESNPQEATAAEAQQFKEQLKEAEARKVDVNVDQPGAITKLPPPEPSSDQPWQEWLQPVVDILAKLPDYVGAFFYDYRQPLITLGLLVSGVVTVKVTLAVLDAINDIPLLAPIFELVGIGYTAWFVSRYLLKAQTRKELAGEFEALKGQVVGKNSSES